MNDDVNCALDVQKKRVCAVLDVEYGCVRLVINDETVAVLRATDAYDWASNIAVATVGWCERRDEELVSGYEKKGVI